MTHFNHKNVLKYNKRPWANLPEMNEGLIDKWNAKVGKKDFTWINGDFAFDRHGYFLQRLNGKKGLILGSHDKMPQVHLNCFSEVAIAKEIRIGKQVIFMSHCCQRIWEKSHYGSWHLFGHSHGRLQTFNFSKDVGVDVLGNDYSPLSFDQIVLFMEQRRMEMENMGRKFLQNGKVMWQQDDVRFFQHNNIIEPEMEDDEE